MTFNNRKLWLCALLLTIACHCTKAEPPAKTNRKALRQATAEPAKMSDAEFSRRFQSRTATANGIRLHYMIGGKGEPLVLLHGWPETWREWKPIMPMLAQNYTVIAVDIRGAGESERSTGGYDKKTMAADVHELVRTLGYLQIRLVGHDIGLMVAYAYAAQWPEEVQKLVLMDAALPGSPLFDQMKTDPRTWHFSFHNVPEFPEYLTAGREKWYIGHFMKTVAGDKSALTDALVTQIAKPYATPGGMHAGFEWYRAFEQDGKDNKLFFATKLPMPLLGVSGDALIPNQKESFVATMMRPYTNHVQSAIIPNSGHWLTHEQPAALTQALLAFLGDRTGENITQEENTGMASAASARETAQRAFQAWQKGEQEGKYDDILAMMADKEQFVIFSHPNDAHGVYQGAAAWDAWQKLIFGRISAPNHLTFSHVATFVNGNDVAFQFDSNGEVHGISGPYKGYNLIVFTIKEGKVAGFREYLSYIDPTWFQPRK